MLYTFNEEEYRKGVVILKNNKAAGRDDVLVEQLKNLGHKAQRAAGNCEIPTLCDSRVTDQYLSCVIRTNSTKA